MTNIVISWLFGLGAMACLFLVYQQKKRENLLLCKLLADVCWVTHYLCIGAFGGAIPNFVGVFRELVFVHRENKPWANSKIWPVMFITINISLGFITLNSLINLMPIFASIFVTISLWLKNPSLIKLISVPVSLSFLIYDVIVGSYIGIINESLAILSIVISFIKRKENFYEQ